MSSKTNTFENQLLLLLFNNTSITNIGDAGGIIHSTAAGNLYIRLCTDATVCDDATLGTETTYTGYVAGGLPVVRSSSGWTVVNNSVSNAAAILFPMCSGNPETIRYIEIWKNNSSLVASERLYWGQLYTDLDVVITTQPNFAIGTIIINED